MTGFSAGFAFLIMQITIVGMSMRKTLFILPSSPLFPPNMTALLSSTAVNVNAAHGGGLSPVVAGQLHTPVGEIGEKYVVV